MNLFEFFILSVACWRLTYLFTDDVGPADIFLRARVWASHNSSLIHGLLSCFYCASIWVAGLLALVSGANWLEWLALSGSAILIEEIRRKVEA